MKLSLELNKSANISVATYLSKIESGTVFDRIVDIVTKRGLINIVDTPAIRTDIFTAVGSRLKSINISLKEFKIDENGNSAVLDKMYDRVAIGYLVFIIAKLMKQDIEFKRQTAFAIAFALRNNPDIPANVKSNVFNSTVELLIQLYGMTDKAAFENAQKIVNYQTSPSAQPNAKHKPVSDLMKYLYKGIPTHHHQSFSDVGWLVAHLMVSKQIPAVLPIGNMVFGNIDKVTFQR